MWKATEPFDITHEDWKDTLRVFFVRELEDAIESHMALLSKISGIKKFKTDPQIKLFKQIRRCS